MSDIVYIPYKTPILEEAERKGNHIYNGLDMFVYQGAESFKIWTNKDADINSMKTAVLQQLKENNICLLANKKRYLRSLAHNIDPIFQIGKGGINENMIKQIDDTLENRELIKVHVLQNNFDDKKLAETLSEATRSELVQVIGSMIVIYRESKDNKEIELP